MQGSWAAEQARLLGPRAAEQAPSHLKAHVLALHNKTIWVRTQADPGPKGPPTWSTEDSRPATCRLLT